MSEDIVKQSLAELGKQLTEKACQQQNSKEIINWFRGEVEKLKGAKNGNDT